MEVNNAEEELRRCTATAAARGFLEIIPTAVVFWTGCGETEQRDSTREKENMMFLASGQFRLVDDKKYLLFIFTHLYTACITFPSNTINYTTPIKYSEKCFNVVF